jgi:tetratricopeptide (TPR) repeat protein
MAPFAPRDLRGVTLAAALSLLGAPGPGCFASRRVHPRSAEELRRGYERLATGDLERAEVAFAHALEFDPDLVEGENGLGVVARARGDLPEALRRFGRALAVDDGFAEGHANRGEALLAAGRLDAAERALSAALSLNPDLLEARQNLGRALLRRGLAEPGERRARWEGARRALLHVLEADERRASAHADLAIVDFLSGRPARAERSWRRAAELDPGSPETALGLCVARAALGRCAEAAAECGRCLRLAPGDARCARSLAALEGCASTGALHPPPGPLSR